MINSYRYLRSVTTLSHWLVFKIVVLKGIRFNTNKGVRT
jgi:hypothetical protein